MDKYLKYAQYAIWTGLVAVTFIPLIVNGAYFFPFIFPKTVVFRIIVEIIFLVYLWLAIKKEEYRPKFNWALLLFVAYIVVVTISSLMAGSLRFSFWSNNERSEGILLLLHLLLYLVVLSGFLRRLKDWLVIFEASFISGMLVSIYALAQYFHIGGFIVSAGGGRLTSTLGNAGYVAGYLIFNIFFGLLLYFYRKNKYLKFYYVGGILLQIFIVLNTLTRGGIIALFFSLFIFILYLSFSYAKKSAAVRNIGISLVILLIILAGLIFINKDKDWVQHNDIFERISSISTESTTAKNRLLTWKSAWQGFQEKPILGYGYENFYQVFDKYFEPGIYRKAGSVVWFDRAHNIIFDRLITGGIIGLLLYLAVLFLPLWFLWKYARKNPLSTGYLIPLVLTLAMVAYFIQNLFIFEALVTYIPLFIVLAFLSQFVPTISDKYFAAKRPYLILLTIVLVFFIPLFYAFNIKWANTNAGFIKAIMVAQTENYQEGYNDLVDVIDQNTAMNQEYRQHLGEIVSGAVGKEDIDQDWLAQATIKAEREFIKQLDEKPLSARNYIMYMRFLNKTYSFDVGRLNRAISLGEKAAALSPSRAHIYIEIGYSQYYLGRYFKDISEKLNVPDDLKKAETMFDASIANMQKSIDINPLVVDNYLNMIMVLFATDRQDQVGGYLATMDELDLNYHAEDHLTRIANSAIHTKHYDYVEKFYLELTKINPKEPNYWINLALAYASQGKRAMAIATAGKVAEFGGEYEAQSAGFIEGVNNGEFE